VQLKSGAAKGNFMVHSPTLIFFIICGFLSAWLSFSIAYLMFKSWRMVRVDYLLGFPIGFSLLALAYAILDMAYIFPLMNAESGASLLLTSWGFVFLAVTYFLRYGSAGTDRSGTTVKAFATLIVLTVASVISVILAPAGFLPLFSSTELFFRVVNVVILAYIIYSLNKALKTETGLSNVVLGFTFLTIDQYSLLLNTLDRTFVWSVLFAQLVRIAGLFILTIFLVRGFQRRVK
jgi:hypothetical protein